MCLFPAKILSSQLVFGVVLSTARCSVSTCFFCREEIFVRTKARTFRKRPSSRESARARLKLVLLWFDLIANPTVFRVFVKIYPRVGVCPHHLAHTYRGSSGESARARLKKNCAVLLWVDLVANPTPLLIVRCSVLDDLEGVPGVVAVGGRDGDWRDSAVRAFTSCSRGEHI